MVLLVQHLKKMSDFPFISTNCVENHDTNSSVYPIWNEESIGELMELGYAINMKPPWRFEENVFKYSIQRLKGNIPEITM